MIMSFKEKGTSYLFVLCLVFITAQSLKAQSLIPVDLVTGRAQISVPLAEVSSGSISVPIALSYNSGGVKPQAAGGDAGVNWNLVAGGQIYREVRGLPDDYFGNQHDDDDLRLGWLASFASAVNGFTPTGDTNLGTCSDEYSDWFWINDLHYRRDTEPDVFSFNAPGLSGSFVFGADLQPKLLAYQDLKIEFLPTNLDAPISSIIITKSNGVKYTFSVSETIVRQTKGMIGQPVTQFNSRYELFRKSTKFTSQWGLTKIESPGGGLIELCYGGGCNVPFTGTFKNIAYSSDSIQVVGTSASANSEPNTQLILNDIITRSYIAKIQSKSTNVFFDWLGSSSERISEILIEDAEYGNQKSFQLWYTSAMNPLEINGRFFLKEIFEGSTLCERFPAYSFTYHDIIPASSSYSSSSSTSITFDSPRLNQDYFGYFNNKAVSKNPTIYFYNNKAGAERYRFYPISGLTATATINGADRTVNPNTVHYGSLSSITYPTGGVANIEYEPNSYYDATTSTTQYGPGIRVKRIVMEEPVVGADNTVIDYDYELANGHSSGQWIYRSVFGYHDVTKFYAFLDDQSPESYILYSNVKVSKTGSGYTNYEYLLPGTYPLTSAGSDWTATISRIARPSGTCHSAGELKMQAFLYPFGQNTNFDFERGLLSKVTDYASGNKKVFEKTYTYQRLTTPKVIVKGVRYERLQNTSDLNSGNNTNANLFVFNNYSLITNVGKVMLTETQRAFDQNDPSRYVESSTTHTYSNTHYMLSEIAKANSDNVVYKEKFKYAKDFANLTQPNPSSENAVMLKKLNDGFRHGVLVEKTNSADNNVIGASLTLFGGFLDNQGNERALPKEVRIFKGSTGFAQASVSPASGANQVLNYNSNVYQPSVTYHSYDFRGNLTSMEDKSKNVASSHFGYNKSVPVAKIGNARADQVIYDGFESESDGGFDSHAFTINSTNSWTGRNSVTLLSTDQLERSELSKGGNKYRYSVRVFSSTASSVIIKCTNLTGSNVIANKTLSYTSGDINSWKHFQGILDLTSAPVDIRVSVETTATTSIDDFIFYPEDAVLNTYTYEPLFGISSETDSRGASVFYEYDALGRLKYVKDQDRNLKQSYDYYYAVQPDQELSTSIWASHKSYQVVKGVTVDYRAPINQNCGISPVTYDWYVDGVKLGVNLTEFSYTYDQAKTYELKMVASHPVVGVAESPPIIYEVRDIGTGPIGVRISDLTTGDFEYSNCDLNPDKSFGLSLTGCYILEDATIKWSYVAGGNWTSAPSSWLSNNSLTLNFDPILAFNTGQNNLDDYDVKVEVTGLCPVTGEISTMSKTVSVRFNFNDCE